MGSCRQCLTLGRTGSSHLQPQGGVNVKIKSATGFCLYSPEVQGVGAPRGQLLQKETANKQPISLSPSGWSLLRCCLCDVLKDDPVALKSVSFDSCQFGDVPSAGSSFSASCPLN